MEFFNPQMEQGSWEELIPTISFDGEIPHSQLTELTDHSWKTLAACSYEHGNTPMNYEVIADALHTSLGEDNDLGVYLNERSTTPPPSEVTTYISDPTSVSPNTSDPTTHVSPNSSISSGIFSCSDLEALSPPSFDSPGSPEVFRSAESDPLNSQMYMPYHTPSSMEHLTINQRLLSYAPLRTNVPSARAMPILPAPVGWSSSQSRSLPMTTAKAFNKPPESYIALISKAILSMPSRRALLSDIYSFALENYEYYRTANKTWKNAIRHNLSINECFIKNGRAPQGRGFYWSIHPACVPSFVKGDFRRREARQLAVDMDKMQQETTEKHSSYNNYV